MQVGDFSAELQRAIDSKFITHTFAAASADKALAEKIAGIITRSNYRIAAEMIAVFPNLRIVATSGVGYDGIPLAATQARGITVDEAALIEALNKGKIKGAGLDVYNNEPRPDPAILALPNTVLTPHMGSATQEALRLMLKLTLDKLRAVLSGKLALTPVLE